MTRVRRTALYCLTTLPIAASALALRGLAPQEPAPEGSEAEEAELETQGVQELGPDFGTAQPQQELRELFIRVERNLLRMESYLLDASAGDSSALQRVGPSGMDELLEEAESQPQPSSGVAGVLGRTRAHGRRVLEDIDRIVEIANEQGGSCSQPGDGQGSPLEGNEPGSTERMEGRKDPTAPRPTSAGQDPRGNRDSDAPPRSSPAERAPDQPTQAAPAPVEDDERWGELPIYTRELFRAGGGRDLPPQYRDWIDAYYRRLNRRSAGD